MVGSRPGWAVAGVEVEAWACPPACGPWGLRVCGREVGRFEGPRIIGCSNAGCCALRFPTAWKVTGYAAKIAPKKVENVTVVTNAGGIGGKAGMLPSVEWEGFGLWLRGRGESPGWK